MGGSALFALKIIIAYFETRGKTKVQTMRKKSIRKHKPRFYVLLLTLILLLPLNAMAQGGLFQRGTYNSTDNTSMFLRDSGSTSVMSNQTFGTPVGGGDLTNQTFDVPLGSGLFVMLMTVTGYAALKTNKKNQKKERRIVVMR